MTLPADGIYPNLAFHDYLAWEAWGSSSLKAMRIGPPARVLWEREHRHDTDATILGTAAHCRILTPDLFDATYAVKPAGMTFASKEGKAWRDDPSRAGKVIIGADDADLIEAIEAAFVDKGPAFDALGAAAGVETSLLWTCPTTGERCKARPDWYDRDYIYDLKVSRDAGRNLAYRAYANGWMHQLAHGRTGLRAIGVPVKAGRLVVVAPKAPHYVYCVEVKESALDVLALESEGTLQRLKDCRASGVFPDTPNEWDRVDVPQYALQEAVALAGVMEVDDGE